VRLRTRCGFTRHTSQAIAYRFWQDAPTVADVVCPGQHEQADPIPPRRQYSREYPQLHRYTIRAARAAYAPPQRFTWMTSRARTVAMTAVGTGSLSRHNQPSAPLPLARRYPNYAGDHPKARGSRYMGASSSARKTRLVPAGANPTHHPLQPETASLEASGHRPRC
jgi:hypothetical protein